jgi:hypothetical protein
MKARHETMRLFPALSLEERLGEGLPYPFSRFFNCASRSFFARNTYYADETVTVSAPSSRR